MQDPPKRKLLDLKQEISIDLDPELLKAVEEIARNLETAWSAAGRAFEGLDANSFAECMQTLLAEKAAMDAALDNAFPITIGADRRFDILREFSTDQRGLGLSDGEFMEVLNRGEWLARYRDWERSWVSRLLARQKGRPGRPTKGTTERIYKTWVGMDRPSVYKNELAQKFFGSEFTKADAKERRRLRDMCRNGVERVRKKHAPKSQSK